MVAVPMGSPGRGRRLQLDYSRQGPRGGEAHQDREDLRARARLRDRHGPFGKNKLVFHDEFVSSEIGQVGTQFDGLGHIGCITGKDGDMTEMRYYNGFTEAEMANAYGLQKLGIREV